ncbi:hypothetical protein, partial [Staphylococcus aureus]
MKIEGAGCIDPKYRVHYFPPPDSVMEMEEILPDELQRLVRQIKAMRQYDIVFVDMSSCFNSRNIALLEACDEILFVIAQDSLSNTKAKSFINELDILSQKNNTT